MLEAKIIIGVIAIVLTFVGYIPYIRDIFKKKTTPHIFTWFIWTLAVGITYGLQVAGGGGIGSWITLSVVCFCFFVFVTSLRNGNKDITKSDVVFFILAILALFLWKVIKQPVWSIILIVSVDILGFVPTIRKSWNKPYSETLFTYELNTIRHALSIFALQQFNILTLLFPIAWTLANLLFCILLVVRRKVEINPN